MANPTNLSMVAAICIAATIVSKSSASSGDNRTRIHLSGEVEGYPTNIFCRVPFDIRSTKVRINIVKYDFDKPDEIPELYFQCYWPWSSSGSNLKCSGRRGVYLGYAEGQVLHIQIFNTSRKHEGRYECRHGLADHNDPGAIRDLYVRGTKIGCNTRLISDVTRITCHFNSDLTQSRDGVVLEWKAPAGHKFHRVLTCMWWRSVPRYECYDSMRHHGITVSSLVKDTVIFNVPQKAHLHKGEFLCGTIPEHRNVKVQTCTIQNQAINGQWGRWSEWQACSSTCGGGLRRRIRSCEDPAPAFGGKDCIGESESTENCNNFKCPLQEEQSRETLTSITSELETPEYTDVFPVAASTMLRQDRSISVAAFLITLLYILV